MKNTFNGYQGNNDFDFPSDPERKSESNPWENAQGSADFTDIPNTTGWI